MTRWKCRTRKIAKMWASGHHRTTVSGYIFLTKACIDNRKNLLNSSTSSTYPDNMVNFSPLTAQIRWRVWSTPANFNGFRVLAALLHGTLVVGVSRTAALNRGTICIRQGVGHWPTFLLRCVIILKKRVCSAFVVDSHLRRLAVSHLRQHYFTSKETSR